MSDSKPGSKTYTLALSYDRSRCVFERPEKVIEKWRGNRNDKRRGWFCRIASSALTAGYGKTKDDAFVDYVEEGWCLSGFPKGYPN